MSLPIPEWSANSVWLVFGAFAPIFDGLPAVPRLHIENFV